MLVSPDIYAEDFSAAVDFLGTQPFVDRNRIGAIGICGSGSFVISAAKIDPRMKAIATVSMYDMGAANRNALKHSQTVEQRKQIIAAAAEQRYVEFTGGETQYTSGTVHELTADTHPIQREFYDFYRTPRGEYTPKGGSPQLTTHPTLTSNVKFMNFYPFNDIETISPRPMLFITGDVGSLPRVQRRGLQACSRAEGTGHCSGRRPRRSVRPGEPHSVRQAASPSSISISPAARVRRKHDDGNSERSFGLSGLSALSKRADTAGDGALPWQSIVPEEPK